MNQIVNNLMNIANINGVVSIRSSNYHLTGGMALDIDDIENNFNLLGKSKITMDDLVAYMQKVQQVHANKRNFEQMAEQFNGVKSHARLKELSKEEVKNMFYESVDCHLWQITEIIKIDSQNQNRLNDLYNTCFLKAGNSNDLSNYKAKLLECWLFHGTKESNIKTILQNGFNFDRKNNKSSQNQVVKSSNV